MDMDPDAQAIGGIPRVGAAPIKRRQRRRIIHPGFQREGFQIAALFDTLPSKVGQKSRAGVPILDVRGLRKFAARDKIAIAVIAVPAEAAQHVVDQVAAAGIRAILNFSPGTLWAPEDVKLKSVDLTVSLESLSFYLAQEDEG